jgi:hypothetical protein
MSKRSKSTTKPWKAAQPFIMGAARDIQANNPQLQANAGLVNSILPGLASRVNSPHPLTGAAQGYATDVLGGRYLNEGNPYLDDIAGQTRGNVSDQVNSTFSRAGRTAGAQHGQLLTRELADAENRLRYQAYGDERNAMGQAAALTPGLVESELAPIQSLLQSAQLGGTLPLAGAQAMGGLLGPYTQTTQKQGFGSTLGNALGLGLMAFGAGGPFGGVFGK